MCSILNLPEKNFLNFLESHFKFATTIKLVQYKMYIEILIIYITYHFSKSELISTVNKPHFDCRTDNANTGLNMLEVSSKL